MTKQSCMQSINQLFTEKYRPKNLEDLIQAAQQGNKDIKQFECSIFNGKYVTDDIDENYLKNLEDLRSDKSKSLRQSNLN